MNKDVPAGNAVPRRVILRCAAASAVAVPLVGIATSRDQALAQAKRSKQLVAYQPNPKGNQKCENCKVFEPPKGCKTVDGEVAAQGWCKIWVPKQ